MKKTTKDNQPFYRKCWKYYPKIMCNSVGDAKRKRNRPVLFISAETSAALRSSAPITWVKLSGGWTECHWWSNHFFSLVFFSPLIKTVIAPVPLVSHHPLQSDFSLAPPAHVRAISASVGAIYKSTNRNKLQGFLHFLGFLFLCRT